MFLSGVFFLETSFLKMRCNKADKIPSALTEPSQLFFHYEDQEKNGNRNQRGETAGSHIKIV